jgi:hypothetical protein
MQYWKNCWTRRFQCGPYRIKESRRLVLPRTSCYRSNLKVTWQKVRLPYSDRTYLLCSACWFCMVRSSGTIVQGSSMQDVTVSSWRWKCIVPPQSSDMQPMEMCRGACGFAKLPLFKRYLVPVADTLDTIRCAGGGSAKWSFFLERHKYSVKLAALLRYRFY